MLPKFKRDYLKVKLKLEPSSLNLGHKRFPAMPGHCWSVLGSPEIGSYE